MISPNLNLTIPSPTNTSGPQYAQEIQSCFNQIDSHDHSNGNGAQVSLAALSSNIDLDLQTFGIENLKYLSFQNQASATNAGSIAMLNNNLHWNDGTGAYSVSITNNGSINVTGNAGFPGLPSGTASASFSTPSFIFKSSTNVGATTDNGPIKVRLPIAGSNAITLQAPTPLATNYSVTMPSSNPLSTKIMNIDSAGNIAATYDVDNTTIEISGNNLQIKNQAITNAKLAPGFTYSTPTITAADRLAGSYVFSSSFSGFFGNNVTLASATITTTGTNKFILMGLINTYGSGWINTSPTAELIMYFTIEGPLLAETVVGSKWALQGSNYDCAYPYLCVNAGTYTIRAKPNVLYGGATVQISGSKFYVTQIG